jgi:hypothetical protein
MNEYRTYQDVDFFTRYPCSEERVSEMADAIQTEGMPNARVYYFQQKDGCWAIEVRNFWGYDIDLKRALVPYLEYLEDTPLHQVVVEEEEGRYFWSIRNGRWEAGVCHKQSFLKDHREFHLDKIISTNKRPFIDVDAFTVEIRRSDWKFEVDIYEGDVSDTPLASAKAEAKFGLQATASHPSSTDAESHALDSN